VVEAVGAVCCVAESGQAHASAPTPFRYQVVHSSDVVEESPAGVINLASAEISHEVIAAADGVGKPLVGVIMVVGVRPVRR
jgi:hypothetical protein